MTHLQSTLQTVSTVHGDSANGIFANMLLNFEHKGLLADAIYLNGIMNLGKHLAGALSFRLKVDINHRAYYLRNMSICLWHTTMFLFILFFIEPLFNSNSLQSSLDFEFRRKVK